MEVLRGVNNTIIWTDELKNYVIDSIINKKIPISHICKELKIGNPAIYLMFKNNGIEYSYDTSIIRKYTRDSNYFSQIDSQEKAYWLGFLFADGNVSKKSSEVRLQIHKNDISALEEFNKSICSNRPIRINKSDIATFAVADKKIKSDLINLGCTPEKSLTIKFPNIPQEFCKSFILGFFDGDGCIAKGKHRNGKDFSYSFSVIAPIDFIMEMVKHLYIHDNKYYITNAHRTDKIQELKVSGNYRVFKLLEDLYENHNYFCLERKKERYLELKNKAPKWRNPIRKSG